jgi:hypothetical protein
MLMSKKLGVEFLQVEFVHLLSISVRGPAVTWIHFRVFGHAAVMWHYVSTVPLCQ